MRFPHLFRALVLGGAALSGVNCGTDESGNGDPNQILQNQDKGDGGTGGGTAGIGGGTHASGGSSGTGGHSVHPGEGGAGSW